MTDINSILAVFGAIDLTLTLDQIIKLLASMVLAETIPRPARNHPGQRGE